MDSNHEIEVIDEDETVKEEKKDKEKKDKKEKSHKIWKTIKALPNVIKYGILALIVITIASTGVMFGTIVNSQHEVTEFGLENVGVLVTQTAHVTEVSDTKVNRDFFKLFDIPFTESRQIFSIRVDVDASVDFGEISYKQDNDNKTVIVTLPHADIYKATLIDESLKIYLDDESLFSRIDLKKHNEAREELKEEAIKTARNNGILDAADKNAQSLIEKFIKSNRTYKDYKVFFNYIGE